MAVLLGICEDRVTTKATTSWLDNKLGGKPDWLLATSSHPNCRICGRKSVFISQLYCPVSSSPYHRLLYIFACCNQLCQNKDGSWTVLRCQSLPQPDPKQAQPQGNINADLWEAGEVSWSDDEENCVELVTDSCSFANESNNIADTQESSDDETSTVSTPSAESQSLAGDEPTSLMTALSLMDVDSTHDTMSAHCDSVPACSESCSGETPLFQEDLAFNPSESILSKLLMKSDGDCENGLSRTENFTALEIELDPYYINVYDETDFEEDMSHYSNLEYKYLKNDSELRMFLDGSEEAKSSRQKKGKKTVNGCSESATGNEYDKKPDNFDRAVYKFSEKLKVCPQQVLRYSYNGVTLRFEDQITSRPIPPCSCGAPRIFELQLMPGIIEYLKFSQETLLEFGSVYVFTCANNCCSAEPVEDFIFSVDYTDQKLFQKMIV